MPYHLRLQRESFTFNDLKTVLSKASPHRSADVLAGLAAQTDLERVAAQWVLADIPLKTFLMEPLIPYEEDEVTRLIFDSHHAPSFEMISHLTVGEFRDWLLSDSATPDKINEIRNGLTPEMVAGASKIMRIQDLVLVSKKCQTITAFRNRIGMQGTFSTRIQPNHPTDDVKGILASTLDGLSMGCGDAVIGINPATDSPAQVELLLKVLDDLRSTLDIPTQICILTHVTTAIQLMDKKVPMDLIFQSIAGSEAANSAFGINLKILEEAYQAAYELKRGTLGNNFMYFETGQGSALSSHSHHGVDAQTMEARAYAVARKFNPLLVNSVVGFIGPEYLYNGKQIIRAGLEDHFCAKLLGLPMGCDICYTNHAEADQDDMDLLLTLLGAAGCTFIMGVPGADDIMLNYQSTSFHDALYVRSLLNLRPSPEFEDWLIRMQIWDPSRNTVRSNLSPLLIESAQPILNKI